MIIPIEACAGHCVYILRMRKRAIYVGYTNCLIGRIGQHLGPEVKPFDSIEFIPFKDGNVARKHERDLIASLNPIWNRTRGCGRTFFIWPSIFRKSVRSLTVGEQVKVDVDWLTRDQALARLTKLHPNRKFYLWINQEFLHIRRIK